MSTGSIRVTLYSRALALSCLLLCANALAEQVGTPAGVAAKPPVFGARGEVVVTSAFGMGFGYLSRTASSPSFNFDVAPSAHYFVASEFSLGLGLLFRRAPVGVLVAGPGFEYPASEQETSLGVSGEAGYDVPLGARASLWIRSEVGFVHHILPVVVTPFSPTFPNKRTSQALWIELFAPVLFHPAPHCFIGFGPDVWGDVFDGSGRRFEAGASSTVGAWF